MGDNDGDVAADEGEKDSDDDEDGDDNDRRNDLGTDEVGGGIDTHNFQCINLFRHPHTADFGSDARTEVTDQKQCDNGGAQFHHHGGADGEAEGPFRNPRALNLQRRLRGDDAAHTDGHDADNQQGADAHVGTYAGKRQHLLQRAVNSINALRPDLIVFTGDIQNTKPQELYQQMDILSKLKAKDGIYSVLGNHDYAKYVDCSEAEKEANCRETISLEKQLGWKLLLNSHQIIERGKSRIVIAGMENDGDGKRFPQKGNISMTLKGVDNEDFILMLEHDPSAWRRKIIPDGRAQLTLSGHTHKMQFTLFGWCPLSLTSSDFNGWYTEGQQALFVTAGLGGLIPFRFDAPGEIVMFTLKSK